MIMTAPVIIVRVVGSACRLVENPRRYAEEDRCQLGHISCFDL